MASHTDDLLIRGRAKVTTKGQITLPAAVRAQLGIRPGDAVQFVEDPERPGEVRLERAVPDDLFGPWVGYAKHFKGTDVDTLIEEMRGR